VIVVASAVLLVVAWARGGGALGLGLMAVGLAVQLALVARLARASVGGVGGHAEWVRDASTRPRLARSPVWLLGAGLVLAGLAVALLG
jgi:hypothetical protein